MLSNRLSVGGIGLAALHVCWRREPHLVADRHQLVRPVVGRGARFDAYEAGSNRLKEAQHLSAPQLPPRDDRTVCGDTVNLENILRQI